MNQQWRQSQRGMRAYRIPWGATLYDIARRFGTTVEAILAANPHIHPANLRAGAVIMIPEAGYRQPYQPPYRRGCQSYYGVRRGDTPWEIASMHGISLDELMRANPGIDQYGLRVGQPLCIPGGTAAPPPPPPPRGAGCPPHARHYAVQWGDTLYQIAQAEGTGLDALLRANPGVDPDSLYVGQVLCIPRH